MPGGGNGIWPPPLAAYLLNVASFVMTTAAAGAAYAGRADLAAILATGGAATQLIIIVGGIPGRSSRGGTGTETGSG